MARRQRLAIFTAVTALTLLLVGSFFLPNESRSEVSSAPTSRAASATDVAAAAPTTDALGSRACESCHAAVYAEWRGSQHGIAFIDPEVRRLSNDFANQDCLDCHAPLSVFETGINQRVLPRELHREQGVDCLACHALPADQGGGVAAARDGDAPCRPRKRVELRTAEHCGGCHDQHGTVGQWRASPAAAAGRTCIDCHMPKDPQTGRSSHVMAGGSDLELVRAAVTLDARCEGETWTARVANVGAGHNFPTDERSRAGDVFWRPLDESTIANADGAAKPAWRHLYRFRAPYRHETGLVDTTLPAGTTREWPIPVEPGTPAIEVALFYKRTPFWLDPSAPNPDMESKLVQRVEVRRP